MNNFGGSDAERRVHEQQLNQSSNGAYYSRTSAMMRSVQNHQQQQQQILMEPSTTQNYYTAPSPIGDGGRRPLEYALSQRAPIQEFYTAPTLVTTGVFAVPGESRRAPEFVLPMQKNGANSQSQQTQQTSIPQSQPWETLVPAPATQGGVFAIPPMPRRGRQFVLSTSSDAAMFGPRPHLDHMDWEPDSKNVGYQYPDSATLQTPDPLPRLARTSERKPQYTALPFRDSIRLLQIEPGVGAAPIVCSLQLARLDTSSGGTFEALSYSWGSASDGKLEVICDGTVRSVQCNLRDALQQIRLPTQPRQLWVDAICIDQSNDQERSQQVQLMRSIYSTARNVIVWLGKDGNRQSQDAFSVLCSVIKDWQFGKQEMETPYYSLHMQSSSPSKQYGQFAVPAPNSIYWSSVSALFDCTWFWRLWVVQEVTLATSGLVLWGDIAMKWRWVGLAATIIRTSHYKVLKQHAMAGVYNAHLMVRLMFSGAKFPIPDHLKYRLFTRNNPTHPLRPLAFLDLLRLTRQFEVTDTRDRVYGLLGLQATDNDPKGGNLIIMPDYTVSAGETYHKLGLTIIERSKSLRLLCSVQQILDGNGANADLALASNAESAKIFPREHNPTWIPQWDSVRTSTIAPWDLDNGFNAANSFPLERKETSFTHRLIVRGLEITKATESFPIMWNSLDYSVLFHPLVKSFFKTPEGLTLLSTTLTGGRSWYGSLSNDAASVLADFATNFVQFLERDHTTSATTEIPRPDPKGQIQQLQREGISASTIYGLRTLGQNGDSVRFMGAAMAVCNGRRLFLTSSGSLGLGPLALADGDVLFVLSGGEVPFLLRPVEDHYYFVGECFVDGLMQGEAVIAAASSLSLAANIKLDTEKDKSVLQLNLVEIR